MVAVILLHICDNTGEMLHEWCDYIMVTLLLWCRNIGAVFHQYF